MEKEMPEIKIDIDRYRAKEGDKINLKKIATACDIDIDKEAVKTAAFPEALEEINLLQAKLYAQSTYGLIIVLQAMDAAGKDGTIKHVFSHLDPNGVHVVSFKQPNSEEKDHDYMWRINRALPRRGDIGIFNRSHYEDVIVTRVHDLIKEDKLPQNLVNKISGIPATGRSRTGSAIWGRMASMSSRSFSMSPRMSSATVWPSAS